MDNVKVFVLLAGMVALFGVVGGMLGGQSGMMLALTIAAVMSFVIYFNSGKMALRAYRALIVGRVNSRPTRRAPRSAASHSPTEQRVARLRAIAKSAGTDFG